MNDKELKQAIEDDIETLKHLDVEIVESGRYYGEVRRLTLHWFLGLFGTSFAIGLVCIPLEWHSSGMDVLGQILFCLGGSLFFSLLFSLGIPSFAGQFVIFKDQLLPNLKTGDFLMKQLERIARVTYVTFVTILFIATVIAGSPLVGFMVIVAVALTGCVMTLLIEMEAIRLGASVFFIVIKKYFSKNKP